MQQPPYPPQPPSEQFGQNLPPPLPPVPKGSPGPRKLRTSDVVWILIASVILVGLLEATIQYALRSPAKNEPLIIGNHMIWFEAKNQSKTSDVETAAFFETQELLKISYSCQRNSNDGIDVSFGIYQKEGTRKDKLVWYDEVVDCPETRAATVSVEAGEYLAAALTYGNSQWSMKVWQEL